MARRRYLAPEIWIDGRFLRLSTLARLMWVGLISMADDEGIVEADPNVLRAALGLVRHGRRKIENALDQIIDVGLAERYEDNGQAYIFLPRFYKHQTLKHPVPTRLHRPPDDVLAKHPEYVAARHAAFNASTSRYKGIFDADPGAKGGVGTPRGPLGHPKDAIDGSGSVVKSQSAPAADDPPPSPAVFSYGAELMKGKGNGAWHVEQALHDRLVEAYRDVDHGAAYRKAAAWLASNPPKRKTRGGMAKFLHNWMRTAQGDIDREKASSPSTEAVGELINADD